MHDLRFALRQLAAAPGFAAVAVLSLALGIGANTAIFSLVNEFLLRAMPVKDPGELVLLRRVAGARGQIVWMGDQGIAQTDPATGRVSKSSFPLPVFERFRAHHPMLAQVFAYAPFQEANVRVDGVPEADVAAQFVSGDYHAGLGVRLARGRAIVADDDRPGAEPVAVLSHRYWERRFGSDPAAVGRVVQINGVPVTIVGVTGAGFHGALQVGDAPDISVPLAHVGRFLPDRPDMTNAGFWWLRIMGRRAPGATDAQVRAALEPGFQEAARDGWLAAQRPGSQPTLPDLPTLAIEPGGQGENDRRREHARALHVLQGLAGLVLLAACANVANLLLARGAGRRREIAVRLALGASRARIVRQLGVEALVLAALGAGLGLLLAAWSRDLLAGLRPFGGAAVALELPLDLRVLGFTVAAAAATALLFGLAPALRATRLDLTAEFQGGARTLGGGGGSRLSQGLMAAQIALSLVLLTGAGLFVRTLRNLQAIDPGFNPRRLVLFRLEAAGTGYARERFAALPARVAEALERLPGVAAATYSDVPLLSRYALDRAVQVDGAAAPGEGPAIAHSLAVAPNFFAALELPLAAGRGFADRDDAAAPKVAVVNAAFARKYFGTEHAVGRRFGWGRLGARGVEIVGVARDAKYHTLRAEAEPTFYVPLAQHPFWQVNFALRTRGDPEAAFAAVRAAVRDSDPALPVLDLRTQEEQIARLNGQELLFARLSGFFGTLALALACVGLYGLMSYTVCRRTGEIGLRMALGARPAQVLGMILRESCALVALGTALGLAAAWLASRAVGSLLYGLTPTDPAIYATVAALLGAVAALAALLPARRAAAVEPMRALRE